MVTKALDSPEEKLEFGDTRGEKEKCLEARGPSTSEPCGQSQLHCITEEAKACSASGHRCAMA